METHTYRGYDIRITQDTDPMRPDDWDSVGFLVAEHRELWLPNDDFPIEEISDKIRETGKWFYNGHYVFPVEAYIHSGITISLAGTADYPDRRWDVSAIGYVLVPQTNAYHRHKAEECAEDVVKEWDNYLTGNVWGYIAEKDGEQVDSCWGYYGDPEYCLPEAKAAVNYHYQQAVQDHIDKLKNYIKGKVPIIYRKFETL